MDTEVLFQAVTSITTFMAPSINGLNFAENQTSSWCFALLTPSGRGFSTSNGRGLPP